MRIFVAGAGLSGATVARVLAEAGHSVDVCEARSHVAGNCYDTHNDQGVLYHYYGPHLFHTNSDEVWEFLSRFTQWRPYEHRVLSVPASAPVPFPPNDDTIDALFYDGYTAKQWGKHAPDLLPSVRARVPTRLGSRDGRYFLDRHQATPLEGYTAMVERMLDHPNIEVSLGSRAQPSQRLFHDRVFWTGPIDEFFKNNFLPLPYRSLRFEHTTFRSKSLYQPAATINYPDPAVPYTRETEWRRITGQESDWTTITREFPADEGEPFYPVPTAASRDLAQKYRDLARESVPNVVFLGRLGTYRYMNMDACVAAALKAAGRFLEETK